MSEPEDDGRDAEGEPHAQVIVEAAATRGLGRRPLAREMFAVAWSAALGASLSLLVLLLMPEDWMETPVGFERLAIAFTVLWVLALVPALSQALLSRPPPHAS